MTRLTLEERWDRAAGIYLSWLNEQAPGASARGVDCYHAWCPALLRMPTRHFTGREVLIAEVSVGNKKGRCRVFGWSEKHGVVRELWMQRLRWDHRVKAYDASKAPLIVLEWPPDETLPDRNPLRAAVRAGVLERLRAADVARRVGASSPVEIRRTG